MVKKVVIVGAGINGLLAAFLISENYPDLRIDIYDAEEYPVGITKHKGVTHGSKDARHITGSESIGFENSIHKDALRNAPGHEIRGWLLKDEAKLTTKEKNWRDKLEATYIGADGLNELDFAHAELNYKGLKLWLSLARKYPFIERCVIAQDGVEVYLKNQTALENDLSMESEFCRRFFDNAKIKVAENRQFNNLYAKKLVVPGMSIRVRSLAAELLNRLGENPRVLLHWGIVVKDAVQLEADTIVWTAGVTHEQPDEYVEHDVQGIVGCWVTIPNQGYSAPFKIATPTPSAYINFTPDGNELHISGGFGWVGEYVDTELTKILAKPMAEHFIEQVNKYLGTDIGLDDLDYCTRASTPTGKPLCLAKISKGKTNIFITGSAKSGTTHAPVLSEYVLGQIKG